MDIFFNIIQKFFIFEKEPQKIGLSQLKQEPKKEPVKTKTVKKEVKLSDLMRRV